MVLIRNILTYLLVLKSTSAITKNRFVSKILSRISSKLFANVSNSSWDWLGDIYKDIILQNYCQFSIQKQYIPANRKYPVLLMVMNFYNRHRQLLICYWMGGLPGLGHILLSPSFYHQIVYFSQDMFLTNKWHCNCK